MGKTLSWAEGPPRDEFERWAFQRLNDAAGIASNVAVGIAMAIIKENPDWKPDEDSLHKMAADSVEIAAQIVEKLEARFPRPEMRARRGVRPVDDEPGQDLGTFGD